MFFIAASLILFKIAPRSIKRYVLLAASLVYILMEGGAAALAAALCMAVFTYAAGALTVYDRSRGNSGTLPAAFGISALILTLFCWKYLTWGTELVTGGTPGWMSALVPPIGLSFYTFQAISYLADIKSGKIEKNAEAGGFFLYMTWFPKWMSGPIEREQNFEHAVTESVSAHVFDIDRTTRAVTYIIWGMFMKLVIADRIAVAADTAFAQPEEFGSGALIIASLLYTMQIYCDFAGYTDMMLGVSLLFGLEITQNFCTPYFAQSITGFWRAWHISLSSFFRDYLYIPLGGNRKGQFRKAVNTMIVFILCGLWHGAGFTFIIWGLLHGVYNILGNAVKKTRAAFLQKGITGVIVTFCLVSFAWIFFRASSLGNAAVYVKRMLIPTGGPFFSGIKTDDGLILGLSGLEWLIGCISMLMLFIMDAVSAAKKTTVPELVFSFRSEIGRGALLLAAALTIVIFGKYGAGEEIRSFVYSQF